MGDLLAKLGEEWNGMFCEGGVMRTLYSAHGCP